MGLMGKSKPFGAPIETLAYQLLIKEKAQEDINKALSTADSVLKLVAAGAFVASGLVAPNILKLAKPLIRDLSTYTTWKNYNIPYLRRKLKRMQRQELVEFKLEGTTQIITITTKGRKRILKFALNEMSIQKPAIWNGRWWLVTYDIPQKKHSLRDVIAEYLRAWGFYPLEKSVYLHAYPCENEIVFLREYLEVADYVRIFNVSKIENDQTFRDFFGV